MNKAATKTLKADGHYWIVCEGCGVDVRKEHKDATLSTGQNVHEALGNSGERNGYFCGACAVAKMKEMMS